MTARCPITAFLRLSAAAFGLSVFGFIFPGSAFGAGSGEAWIGDPDAAISSDNPYLALAQRNVALAASSDTPEVFWLVWGALANESKCRGEAGLLSRARQATDVLAEKLAEKPSGHWDITILLECVRLWKKHDGADAGMVARWLAAARPSVEHNHTANQKGLAGDPDASWTSVAPNAMFQSAAILALAGELYSDSRYLNLARSLVAAAVRHQLPGGAFSYIHNSGPSALYFGFDTTFLGRYYQLSRDPEARRLLVGMAAYAHEALPNGLFEGASSTWWKHHWGTGGPIHGVEVVAGLSGDPVARALAQYRLPAAQRYWFSYVAMYFWRPDIPVGELGADICLLSENINGPILRRGGWQVVMPQTPYGDTAVGATLTRSGERLRFANYLEAAALPVFLRDSGSYRGRDVSLYMLPPEEAGRRDVIADEAEGWIAAGSAWHPRRAIFSDPAVPAAEGWELAQIWFADADGLAGWMELTPDDPAAALPAPQHTPRGVLIFGRALEKTEGGEGRHHYSSEGLKLELFGDRVASTRIAGKDGEQAWVEFTPAAEPIVTGYGAAISRGDDDAGLRIARAPAVDGVLTVRVTRRDGRVLEFQYETRTNVLRRLSPRAP